MSGSGISDAERMARVIRNAISEKEILHSISENDVMAIAENAMHLLQPSEIRSFIFQCFRNGRPENGLAMLDAALEFDANMRRQGKREKSAEIMGAAVSAIAFLSTSDDSVKEKLYALLEYGEPDVIAAVVENLGRSNEVESFRKVGGLLLRDDFKVQMSAVKYAEDCATKAAFLKRPDVYAMAPAAEEFMRNALGLLEKVYERLKAKNGGHIQKRVAILVAMTYNEILDTTDCKRVNEEPVEEGIYYSLEGHLHEDIGPEALPLLFKMLQNTKINEGVKRCALNTVGRMGNNERYRGKVRAWIRDYVGLERSVGLLSVAKEIRESCIEGRRFSSIPAPSPAKRGTSIVPKTLAPIKK
ncbi:MAG: hypothetical protein GY852_11315 [bacterium]|nr:hypothetical protein [bacterium]